MIVYVVVSMCLTVPAVFVDIWVLGVESGNGACSGVTSALVTALLAPYMGEGEVGDGVLAAGGLAAWTPPPLLGDDDDQVYKFNQLWRFYRRYTTEPDAMPRLFIGRGVDDGGNRVNTLVAGILQDLGLAHQPQDVANMLS